VTAPVAIAPGMVAEQGSGAWLYAVRLGDTIALVDAGRDSKGRPIDAALAALGAARAAVTDVLLTHGHPSETMGLAAVRGARVHAGAGDVDLIAGRERSGRGVDRIVGMVLPHMTAQVVDPIRFEERIEIGGERVLALPVPGHTLGSTAYLVRGVLFVGDAAAIHEGRLVPGTRFMSHDPGAAERAVVRLAQRVADERVERICSSHTGCSEIGSAAGLLRAAAARRLAR
jgi:glyoxylase-like metal-dependent hydrolase (beta-lactamase superfamily II)